MIRGLAAEGDITTAISFRPGGIPSATEDTSASGTPLLKDPVTYAVAGGVLLAGIGGWLLLKGKRRRRR